MRVGRESLFNHERLVLRVRLRAEQHRPPELLERQPLDLETRLRGRAFGRGARVVVDPHLQQLHHPGARRVVEPEPLERGVVVVHRPMATAYEGFERREVDVFHLGGRGRGGALLLGVGGVLNPCGEGIDDHASIGRRELRIGQPGAQLVEREHAGDDGGLELADVKIADRGALRRVVARLELREVHLAVPLEEIHQNRHGIGVVARGVDFPHP